MKYLVSFIFLLALASCKNNPSANKNTASAEGKYDAMASDHCKCWKPFYDLKEETDALIAANKTEELTELSESMEMIEDDLDECLEKLYDKYGEIEEENEKVMLQAALAKMCPKIAELIKEAEAEMEAF